MQKPNLAALIESKKDRIKRNKPKTGIALRPMQLEATNLSIRNPKKHMVINAVTASGKSVASKSIAIRELENTNKNCVFSVPMDSIFDSFSSLTEITYPEKYAGNIHVPSFNIAASEDSTFKKVKKVLSRPYGDISSRSTLCCHPTLAKFGELPIAEIKKLFKDTIIFIDEGHHSATDDENGNCLGTLLRKLLKCAPKINCRVVLITSTFFRNDNYPIIPSDNQDDFITYKYNLMDFLDHNEYVTGIKLYTSISNKCWSKNVVRELTHSLPFRPFVACLPSANHTDSVGLSRDNSNAFLRQLADSGKYSKRDENGLVTLIHKGKKRYILDTVTPHTQQMAKQYVNNNIKSPKKYPLDGIITLEFWSEGADWPEANRVFIVGMNKSLNKLWQKAGRILRDHFSKKGKYPEIYLVYPNIDLKMDVAKSVNNLYKALASIMLMAAVMQPCTAFKVIKKGLTKIIKRDPLEMLAEKVGEDETHLIIEEILNIARKVESSKNTTIPETQDEILKLTTELIQDYGVSDADSDILAQGLINTTIKLNSPTIKRKREFYEVDAVDIDHNFLKDIRVTECFASYGFNFSRQEMKVYLRKLQDYVAATEFMALEEWQDIFVPLNLTKIGYKKVYKEYPGAPSVPTRTYRMTWKELLEVKTIPVLSLKAWRKTFIRLNLTLAIYREVYKEYPGAPSVPTRTYRMTWKELMEIPVPSLKAWRKIFKPLGLTLPKYRAGVYKEYPGAPSDPWRTYKMTWNELMEIKTIPVLSRKEWRKIFIPLGLTLPRYIEVYKDYPGAPGGPRKTYGMTWNELMEVKTIPVLPLKKWRKIFKPLGLTKAKYKEVYKEYPGATSDPWKTYKMTWNEAMGIKNGTH